MVVLFSTKWVSVPIYGQEWYIPKRTTLLKGGAWEAGLRTQMSANSTGNEDSLRLEEIPHLRYSPFRRLELYAEVGLAYAYREDAVFVTFLESETTGVGDAFAQVAFETLSGEDWRLLTHLDGSFPSGKNPHHHLVPTGSGHFTAAAGQTAMTVIDPVVLFAHLGYQHTFRRFFPGVRANSAGDGTAPCPPSEPCPGAQVAPGWDLRFRFGSSLALNPRVQTSFHVTGNAVASTKLNGKRVVASRTTLVRLGWGLDWSFYRRLRMSLDAAFGMTKNTPDATLAMDFSIRL